MKARPEQERFGVASYHRMILLLNLHESPNYFHETPTTSMDPPATSMKHPATSTKRLIHGRRAWLHESSALVTASYQQLCEYRGRRRVLSRSRARATLPRSTKQPCVDQVVDQPSALCPAASPSPRPGRVPSSSPRPERAPSSSPRPERAPFSSPRPQRMPSSSPSFFSPFFAESPFLARRTGGLGAVRRISGYCVSPVPDFGRLRRGGAGFGPTA